MSKVVRPNMIQCSFCGKDQSQVLLLIAGPNVEICDECVALCINILATQGHQLICPPQGGFKFVYSQQLFEEMQQANLSSQEAEKNGPDPLKQ